jgi:hypothetical protein
VTGEGLLLLGGNTSGSPRRPPSTSCAGGCPSAGLALHPPARGAQSPPSTGRDRRRAVPRPGLRPGTPRRGQAGSPFVSSGCTRHGRDLPAPRVVAPRTPATCCAAAPSTPGGCGWHVSRVIDGGSATSARPRGVAATRRSQRYQAGPARATTPTETASVGGLARPLTLATEDLQEEVRAAPRKRRRSSRPVARPGRERPASSVRHLPSLASAVDSAETRLPA